MQNKLTGLYAITDSHLMNDYQMINSAEAAIKGGANIIQYRDKSNDNEKRIKQAQSLLAICQKNQILFIINDDIQLAKLIGADGVHLGSADLSIAIARDVLGLESIIGVSCYGSLERAMQAQEEGADYISFGACYPSLTKPEAPIILLDKLSMACQQLTIPVVAIGGITINNAREVIASGVNMVAVVHELFSASNVEQCAQDFCQLFKLYQSIGS